MFVARRWRQDSRDSKLNEKRRSRNLVELFLFCFSLENLKREQRNLSQLNRDDSFFRRGFQSALEGPSSFGKIRIRIYLSHHSDYVASNVCFWCTTMIFFMGLNLHQNFLKGKQPYLDVSADEREQMCLRVCPEAVWPDFKFSSNA